MTKYAKVNILGQYYEIEIQTEKENPKLIENAGICEFYSKKIIICDMEETEETLENFDKYIEKVIRHEIVHAFMFESGLDCQSKWGRDEELIDFLSIQIPKISKVYNDLNLI